MEMKKIFKKIVVIATTFTIIISGTMPLSQMVFASEEYRLELFNQLADKVTTLYYKEAIVGLEVLDEIYSDPNLTINIQKHLDQDIDTKNYLIERGFDQKKINEIIEFIDDAFPNIEDMKNEENKNIIKRLINTTLVDENKTLSFTDYDNDIEQFGKDLYEILPFGVHDAFDIHFKTEEEKTEAIIKIIIEFIYDGYGKVIYDKNTEEYVELKLEISDKFIENVNDTLGIKILNESSKKSANIFLVALQDTIKANELEKIFGDISLVINMVGTNHDMARRYENILEIASVEAIEEKDITRAEIIKLVLEPLGLEPIEYTGAFIDVKSEDFYSGYISKAKSIGIINGYKDNTFRPNVKVKTAEVISITSRAIEYSHGVNKLSLEQIENALKDVKHKEKIEYWARESVAKLIILGVIANDYQGDFGNEAFVTREEAIKLINNIQM